MTCRLPTACTKYVETTHTECWTESQSWMKEQRHTYMNIYVHTYTHTEVAKIQQPTPSRRIEKYM